jgi:SacI restriction endonuclease
MTERVPKREAESVAEAAVALAARSEDLSAPEAQRWVQRVRELSELCKTLQYKTYIAALGTALLAKATNPRIDAYSLKAGDQSGSGSYSARTVVSVLVEVSRRHRFDLGATGREPMNNRPFINNPRITLNMEVHAQARPALRLLCELCHEVNQLDAPKALVALAAFIHVRADYVPRYTVAAGTLAVRRVEELSSAITAFVLEASERGLRAQACVGGLLDVWVDPTRVRVGKLHEPDRRTPGDVAVLSVAPLDTSPFERILEVRDKHVGPADISAFIHKVAQQSVRKAAIVAIARDQGPIDVAAAREEAQQCGVALEIFASWDALTRSLIFWSAAPELDAVERAARQIRARLEELEAPAETVAAWDARVLRPT